jgi:hypothetical protein
LGSFGDIHLRRHALPKKLEMNGIKPLVVSSADFPLEVYEAAMKVSGGGEIFFERNGRIIYSPKYSREIINKTIFPVEYWKKYGKP